MSRYLIIANETVGGDELVDEVRRRAGTDASFHVVVPAYGDDEGGGGRGDVADSPVVAGGGPTSAGSFADPAMASNPQRTETGGARGDVSARESARLLLEHVIGRVEEAGDDVTGDVGQPDAIEAARDALADGTYDEIILATPHAGASKVVGQDLPSRLEQAVDVPVTTVYGKRAEPRATE